MDRIICNLESTTTVPWQLLAGRRILLTGGSGFFGCNLLTSYLSAWNKHQLDGYISVLTRDAASFVFKAPQLATHPAVQLIQGDLLSCDFGASSWDMLIHAAVEYGSPLDILECNVLGTRRLLDLAQQWGVSRVLFTSSGAVYGTQPPTVDKVEEDFAGAPALNDQSAYGEAKRMSELHGMLHGERHGYAFLIARCFAFLGPWLRLDSTGAAGNFIGDALAGRPIHIHGDGQPFRSYLYGEDLAEWLWTILLKGVHGRPYNVGSSEAISIYDLAQRVRDLIAPGVDVQITSKHAEGLPPRYVPSVARARMELGLSQRVNLDQAILRTANWNRNRSRSN